MSSLAVPDSTLNALRSNRLQVTDAFIKRSIATFFNMTAP
jgi:hypothetical protein